MGHDFVDGGEGLDVLSLDFSYSDNKVDFQKDGDSNGTYIAGNDLVKFENIEVLNVIGSGHDDRLFALTYNSNAFRSAYSSIVPEIDGGSGHDELVVDYSQSQAKDIDIYVYGNTLLSHDVLAIS